MPSFLSPKSIVLALLILVVAAAFGAVMWWEVGGSADLKDYGTVPDFVLTDQEGRPLSNHDLAGQIWVANFVFTRCGGTCPMLTRKMQEIENWIQNYGKGEVKIVSFSVDPARDTPADLKKYADMFGIDTDIWKFVTGPEPQMRAVVVQGFKSGMEQVGAVSSATAPGDKQNAHDDGDSLFEILHGERFVLVDRQGAIRGFYSADREGLNQLKAALVQLRKQSDGVALTSR